MLCKRTSAAEKRSLFLYLTFILLLMKNVTNEILEVDVCPGSTVSLPCPALAPIQVNDRALAAFWYKDDQVTPFYMVDARSSPSIEQGKHRQLSSLGNRATFNVSTSPAILYLDVETKEDAGTYVCRVDSYRSLTRTSTVKLIVLSPTPKLFIYEGEKLLSDIAGPYREGSDLELTCELTGAEESLPMQVLWTIRGQVVDSTFKVLPSGKIRNDYRLRSIERNLWMVAVTCVAARSPNVTHQPFLVASVQLDLFLRPLDVRISPTDGTCREGSVLRLVCRTWGSRPPAEITWWMKSFRLYNVSGHRFEKDASSSTLNLVPMASDHGKVIVCRAENPKLPGVSMTDSVMLNVTFPPKVSLSLKTYSSSSLSEGDTVALICNVMSNPAVGPVLWSFVQETSVAPPQKRFPLEGSQTLVLERLQPWHKGSYRCRATNSEGVGESNSLWLAVRHRPICKAGQQVSYGAYLGETLSIRCEVEAEPATVSFHWGFSNTVLQHSNVSFVNRGLKSVATYTPTDDIHLGSLFCWANNSAGEQHVPCTFTVFKPVAPNRPKNCQVLNRTHSSFMLTCEAGYDGGAPQRFYFRAKIKGSRDDGLSLSSPLPLFNLSGLPSGSTFQVSVFSRNKIGKSHVVTLETTTLKTKRKGPWTWKGNRSLLISSILVMVFAILTLAAAAILRHRSRPFLL
ncbi:nephrin-like [Argiope bruennichi]|uniref:nephrin-like n=1 Tax=Argiope bruennichi TaxID=94029 RepID=UPI0024959B74|nr:nephrin-like [Argiope bruennichi]